MYKHITYEFKKYHRLKEIMVYLPDDYDHTDRYYPTLYINDGQNAFFDNHSFMGVSWGFEDYVRKHHLDLIMIAIPCVFDDLKRTTEYSPWQLSPAHSALLGAAPEMTVGGEGDDYIHWIMDDLKQYIDRRFRVDHDDTAIIGSSMGAIISAYALLAYPEVFVKAAAVSIPWWLSFDEFVSLSEHHDYSMVRAFYFDCGDHEGTVSADEDEWYLSSNQAMYQHLAPRVPHLRFKTYKDAVHNEKAWRERMDEYMSFLYPDFSF